MVKYKINNVFHKLGEKKKVNPLDYVTYGFKRFLIELLPRTKNHPFVGKVFCSNGQFKQVERYLSDSLWLYKKIEIQPPSLKTKGYAIKIIKGQNLYQNTELLSNKGKLFSEEDIFNNLNGFYKEKSQCK